MDIDALMRAGETVTSSIINQDTTELAELLSTDACEMKISYDAPAIPGALNTAQQPPQFSQSKAQLTQANCGPVNDSRTINGVKDIALLYKKNFAWLQSCKAIAEPNVVPEARRGARKGRGEEQPKEKQDVKSISSRLLVTWGRPNFLLQEAMYFTEDGRLFLIERELLTPEDAGDMRYVEDRAAFFGEGRARIAALNASPPVLDFSFCNLTEPMDMLRVVPGSGKKHKASPILVPETKDDETGLYMPQGNNNGGGGANGQGGNVVKAKNRKGEEGAYIMDSAVLDTARTKMKKADEDELREQDVLRGLAAKLTFKFDAEAVRCCNNTMSACTQLVPVFRSLVANYALTITWVDLSCNNLSLLPMDLGALPLTTLYAHSNSISNWENIVEAITPLKKLSVLTLFGNPIATNDPNYKAEALSRISRIKDREVKLKSLDFVAVSRCDKSVSEMHYQKRNPSPRRNLTPRARNY